MTDTFRKNKGILNDDQKGLIQEIKEKAEELHDLYRGIGKKDHEISDEIVDNRCISIAKTELESSVMWATKGFSKTN